MVIVLNTGDSRGRNDAVNFQAQKKLCPERYHSYLKYLFIIKSMSNLHNLFVGVLNGFVRKKLLLTTIDFYIRFYF